MRKKILEIVLKELEDLITSIPLSIDGELNASTTLYGKSGVLDSMGLVSLIAAVEQAINDEFSISITIASDKAMSQKQSPFRSAETLTEWISSLMEEAQING